MSEKVGILDYAIYSFKYWGLSIVAVKCDFAVRDIVLNVSFILGGIKKKWHCFLKFDYAKNALKK